MKRFLQHSSNYDKKPSISIDFPGFQCFQGWEEVLALLQKEECILLEHYHGVDTESYMYAFTSKLKFDHIFDTNDIFKDPAEIDKMVFPDVTNDRVFGYKTRLQLIDFFDEKKLQYMQEEIAQAKGIHI
jgi:hypothetical protein